MENLEKLGRGVYAKIFRISIPEHGNCALKVFRQQRDVENFAEYIYLRKCQGKRVIRVIEKRVSPYALVLELGSSDLYSIDLEPQHIKGMIKSLRWVHHKGIIHRDVSRRNFLLVDGKVKICDFGLSIIDDGKILNQRPVFAPLMRAPELWYSYRFFYGKEVDVWALGVMLFDHLTNKIREDEIELPVSENPIPFHYYWNKLDSLPENGNEKLIYWIRKMIAPVIPKLKYTEPAHYLEWLSKKYHSNDVQIRPTLDEICMDMFGSKSLPPSLSVSLVNTPSLPPEKQDDLLRSMFDYYSLYELSQKGMEWFWDNSELFFQ